MKILFLLSLVLSLYAKTIYLTFDDGPVRGTKNVLEVLSKQNVKATFFMVGKHIVEDKESISIYKKITKNPLFLVTNHSFSHANNRYRRFYYSSSKKIIFDFQKTKNILNDNNISKFKSYTRLPGRNVFRLKNISKNDIFISKKQTQRELKNYDALYKAGFFLYGWDDEWEYDYEERNFKKTPYEMLLSIKKNFKRNKIIQKEKFILLLHDNMFQNYYGGKKQLTQLIRLLKKDGWIFETIDDYIK